ncbi:MAG: hypothetical protein GY757_47645 [bacterium]|nr:hypothetical protein [bacterium]
MKNKKTIYLASSAAPHYDLIETVKIASLNGFDGVQLYLGDRFLNREYLRNLTALLNQTNPGVIIHLPDIYNKMLELPVIELLSSQIIKRALIHFRTGMTIPAIPGVDMGLENAVFGYEPAYYNLLRNTIKENGLFFVFDVPRLFGVENIDRDETDGFIKETLAVMREKDVLHLIDQRDCGNDRKRWCCLGDGVLKPYMDLIANFPGVTVLEYEDLNMALESKKRVLKIGY